MKITELNEADLLSWMRNFEDHLVERKVVKDERDWKKTAVASVPNDLVRDFTVMPNRCFLMG